MAYRGDDAALVLEAPTSTGPLRLELAPRQITLSVPGKTLQITDQLVTLGDAKKQESLRITGRLVVARDVPHEDLGVWIEASDKEADKPPGMRRIFGVEPVSLFDPGGLAALQRLDALAQRLRTAVTDLGDFAGDIRRAVEIGRGVDKVLFVDHGDHHAVYARKLFKDRARLALSIYAGGRMILADDGTELTMTTKFGITVSGDYLRFIDPEGTDLGRLAIPWITPEGREELARRIGQLVPG
jgi:hypothetical protein